MKATLRVLCLLLILAMLVISVPAVGDTSITVDGQTILSATGDDVYTYQNGNTSLTVTADSITLTVSGSVTPASGVLFIPETVYELELPDIYSSGWDSARLDFDPFLYLAEGSCSWIYWDTATILTECGGLKDLTYVCAVESLYPEGNYITRVVAFYRNDAEKSLATYHITYQTDEHEYYTISYFGHHYREASLAMQLFKLTKKEKEDAAAAGISEATAPQNKIDAAYTGGEEVYFYDNTSQQYVKITSDNISELTNKNHPKSHKVPAWFTPYPDTIYAGIYDNGEVILRNGSGRFMGGPYWFEWDYDSGAVTRSYEAKYRLFDFESPRVRVRAEALGLGHEDDEIEDPDFYNDPDFYDADDPFAVPEYAEENPEYAFDDITVTNTVFFQTQWTEEYLNQFATAAAMAGNEEGRKQLAALMIMEFTYEASELAQPDTSMPIYVATQAEDAIVAFDTDQGYVRLYLSKNPLLSCYSYLSDVHDPNWVKALLETECDEVWTVDDDDLYDLWIEWYDRFGSFE